MMHSFQNYLLLNVYSKPREQQQQKRIKISNIILQQILIKRACWKIKMKHSYFKCLGENTHLGKIYHWENCLVYQHSDWTDFTYQVCPSSYDAVTAASTLPQQHCPACCPCVAQPALGRQLDPAASWVLQRLAEAKQLPQDNVFLCFSQWKACCSFFILHVLIT